MATRRDERRRSRNDQQLVDIPDTAEVRITNDHNGRYVMKDTCLNQFKIELKEAGSEEWLTFKELRMYRNAHPQPFETLRLMITGVRNANKIVEYVGQDNKKKKKTVPIELKDIIRGLGLSAKYESHQIIAATTDTDTPDGIDIEDFIISSSYEEFIKIVEDAVPSLRFKIADTMIGLYAKGEMLSAVKLNHIEEIMGSPFFDAIDQSRAYKGGAFKNMEGRAW